MRFERRIAVDAPPDAVFAYLANFPRHSEWAADPLRIEKLSIGPVQQGTAFRSVGQERGVEHEQKVTITEFVPNERITFEAEAGFGVVRHWFRIEPASVGVRLTKGTEELLRVKFPANLITHAWNWFVLPGALAGDLRRIKARLEQQAPAG
jgi:uncharacterized protein YndB with AHSA1/START domain